MLFMLYQMMVTLTQVDANNVNILQTNGHINGLVMFRAVYLKDGLPKICIEQHTLPKL